MSRQPSPKERVVVFDVMLHERFVCTLRMPVTFDVIKDYVGDKPVIDDRAIVRYVERKRPTLKGKDYNICFCTGGPQFASRRNGV